MAPSRFTKERKREVTPFRDEPPPASMVPLRPTTPAPVRPSSPVDPAADPNVYYSDRPVTPAPAEWTSYDAPMNFTWVIPDELCGMGWPKSRDQVCVNNGHTITQIFLFTRSTIFPQANKRDTQ